MYFIPFETTRLRLRPQEAKDAGSCAVMRALGFAPAENGTFRRSGLQRNIKI